jgi:hypothetical protein
MSPVASPSGSSPPRRVTPRVPLPEHLGTDPGVSGEADNGRVPGVREQGARAGPSSEA